MTVLRIAETMRPGCSHFLPFLWGGFLICGLSGGTPAQAGKAVESEAARLVRVMTSPEEPWEKRSKAELALEKLPGTQVLEPLLVHAAKKMPEGGIWNSAGREADRQAPVAWQIHYAAGRVWFHHTYGPGKSKTVGPVLIKLLGKAKGQEKQLVMSAMYRCWGPECEKVLAGVFFDKKESASNQHQAAVVLVYYSVEPYAATMVKRARAIKPGQKNIWLDLLLESRVKHRTGIMKDVLRMGFRNLELERKEQPRNRRAGYFTAKRLEAYLGQSFSPPPSEGIKPPNDRFFEATVDAALAWWRKQR